MRALLDTNVLIDYYARREPFFEDALKLRIAALFGDVELWATVQSFTDIEFILGGQIPVPELRAIIKASLGFLQVASASSTDYLAALDAGWPDVEDHLIACAAERVKADCLITRDNSGFAEAKVAVFSPKQFLEMLEEQHGVTYAEVDLLP